VDSSLVRSTTPKHPELGFTNTDEEHPVHGRLGQRDVAPELSLVHELTEAQARGAHQTTEIRQCADRSQILKIALEVGAHEAVEPDRALSRRLELEGRGRESAAATERAPVFRLRWFGGKEGRATWRG
jgi:hypothetical protein